MLGYYKMSIIGTSHQAKENGVCQDASDVEILDNGWIVAAIADGLGSAKKSEVGAATAVKTVLSFVKENRPDLWHEESLISLLRIAYHKAMKAIILVSEENKDDLSDYDTTLTTIIYNGVNVVYGHVGDGGVITLSSFGDFSVLTEAQKGESFNETYPLRAGPYSWNFGVSKEDVCALTMMTDGIFDVACPWLLAKTEQPIYINFIRPFMDMNLINATTQEDFENVQSEMIEFFTGKDCTRITDDKTIVGIINTSIIPETKDADFYIEPNWKKLAQNLHDHLYADDNLGYSDKQTTENNESLIDNLNQKQSKDFSTSILDKTNQVNNTVNNENPIEQTDIKQNNQFKEREIQILYGPPKESILNKFLRRIS